MKRKLAFLLAFVLTLCLFVTACGDDNKSKKEELEELQEEIEDLEEELEELKTQESTLKSEIHEVQVPKFIGKMYNEVANDSTYSQKFALKFKWEAAIDPDVKMGEIFKQDPASGKSVLKGATITLYVNNATPKDIQLDAAAVIEGAHKNDVRKLLQDAGFSVKEIVNSSETIPADHVISINIEKGKPYPKGTEVTMVVSSGPSALPPIEFPAMIIGESQTAAEAILRSHGFKGQIVFFGMNYTDEQFAAEGTVMGVMMDGVLLDELPDAIDPLAELILTISSGEKAE